MSIPALGLSDTVVEGTSGRALMDGPGHRRDTPLPGQQGISVIYGRQAAYGGVFGDITKLQPGDTITITTGQGASTYQVIDVRRAGDKAPAMKSATAGRLTLVTAAGLPFASGGVVRVDADLEGKTQPTPQPVLRIGSLTSGEDPMASDSSGWLPMALLLELVLAVGVLLVLALRRWGKWHTWIVGVPVIMLLGIEIAKQVVLVLPNLY
jgi:LPXTG-site transpeptidase (sortase) family protein